MQYQWIMRVAYAKVLLNLVCIPAMSSSNCCRSNEFFFQVHAELQYYSAQEMVVSEMVAPTLRRKCVSRMTARTVLGSWPASLQVVHCKPTMPLILCVTLTCSQLTFFSGCERIQRDSGWWDDPGT